MRVNGRERVKEFSRMIELLAYQVFELSRQATAPLDPPVMQLA